MSHLSEERLTPGVIDGAAQHAFSQGACAALCYALHEATGWPIIGITDACNVYDGTLGGGSSLHWGVLHPSGQFLDIDGLRDINDVVAAYDADADDGEAVWGMGCKADIEEWYVEAQGEPISINLARSYVEPLLDRLNPSIPKPLNTTRNLMINVNAAIIQTIKNLEQVAQDEGTTISALSAYRAASEVISQMFYFDLTKFDVYIKQYPDLAHDLAYEGEEIAVAIERNLRSHILIDTVNGVEAHITERGNVSGLPLQRLLTDIIELTHEWDRVQSFKSSDADRVMVWAKRCTYDFNANTLRLLSTSLDRFLRKATSSVHLELQLIRGKLQDIFHILKSEAIMEAAA